MHKIVQFKDIYQKCGLADADYKIKHQVIHEVIEIFEYLRLGGDIQSFEVKKEGNKYQAIEFAFSQAVTSLFQKQTEVVTSS